ncbi:RHS repeat-associated core domain-containing protein [Nostoc flagelliforme]|uniref:RHS repeat-associated core domain-containing protein n=1 Tax=Nostoc flagelliforme TaxID=1306274 RepID=UPI001685043B
MPHKDLNDYSPVAEPDRVDLLQTTSYEHKAENLRNLWAHAGECMGVSLEYAYWLDFGSFLKNTETADGERYFYHSDHLGSSAYITTENGYATQFLAYMPYGETLAEQQNGTSYYSPFKFSAKEKDPETGYSYFGARYYSPELSVWLGVDPLSDEFPSWTPYRYGFNNPVKFIDPDGLLESTHVDENGKVVAVYNDGDKGVYKHKSLPSEFEKTSEKFGRILSKVGAEKIGETEYIDEFLKHDNKTGAVINEIQDGAQIMVGESWMPMIEKMNELTENMLLGDVGMNSLPGCLFDIKQNKNYAPYGPATGKMLNGKYATARSAGNFLAGYNASTSTRRFSGAISETTMMRISGQLHSLGNTSGPPYFGEIPYAGRRISEGFQFGRRQ